MKRTIALAILLLVTGLAAVPADAQKATTIPTWFRAGSAGFGTVEAQAALGMRWQYRWLPNAEGRDNTLPMIRTFNDGQTYTGTVAQAMATCAGPCKGLLLLNEPDWGGQDVCDVACQARTLHDLAPQAHAINPAAFVVFGNYPKPFPVYLDSLQAAWDALTDDDLGVFLRENNVLIGFHHYWKSGGYDKFDWRRDFRTFRDSVLTRWGVGIALTEWGCLWSEDNWRQIVVDQKEWLRVQGVPSALFNAGEGETYGGYDMLVNRETLSELGEWYATH